MAKKRFKSGQDVVIVDAPGDTHVYGGRTGTYVKRSKGLDPDNAFDYLVAIAERRDDVRLVHFYDREVKHPWEVDV